MFTTTFDETNEFNARGQLAHSNFLTRSSYRLPPASLNCIADFNIHHEYDPFGIDSSPIQTGSMTSRLYGPSSDGSLPIAPGERANRLTGKG